MPALKVAAAIQCDHCKRWHQVDDTSYVAIFGDVYVGGAGAHALPLLQTEEEAPVEHYFCRNPHCLMSIFDGVLDMMLTRREIKPKLTDEQKEAIKNETEEEAKARKEEEKKKPRHFIDTITLYARGYDRTPRQLMIVKRKDDEDINVESANTADSGNGEENSETSE